MNYWKKYWIKAAVLVFVACSMPLLVAAQDQAVILAGTNLSRVVPPGFYFEGQSAPTQTRNSAAARFGTNRHVIAGMVDTSGYAADVRAKYEGFLITDSPITINGSELGIGAYGFGFSNDGKLNILDLAGNEILSVTTAKDNALRRPRPLMMTKSGEGVRLYSGKDYAVIAAK
jgi:hypothetical protein